MNRRDHQPGNGDIDPCPATMHRAYRHSRKAFQTLAEATTAFTDPRAEAIRRLKVKRNFGWHFGTP